MRTKKILSTCNNSSVNIFIGFLLLLITVLFYNNINNFITYLIQKTTGNVKEGYLTQTIDDLINCTSSVNTLQCGTSATNIQKYQPHLGTCEEAYGNLSGNPDSNMMKICVDEVIPTLGTPLDNQNDSVSTSTCTILHHKYMEHQGDANNHSAPGVPCQ